MLPAVISAILMIRWTINRWRSTLRGLSARRRRTSAGDCRSADRHVLHPELRRRRLPIAEHGEASKCRSITVADCRTSRSASTASHAAAE